MMSAASSKPSTPATTQPTHTRRPGATTVATISTSTAIAIGHRDSPTTFTGAASAPTTV